MIIAWMYSVSFSKTYYKMFVYIYIMFNCLTREEEVENISELQTNSNLKLILNTDIHPPIPFRITSPEERINGTLRALELVVRYCTSDWYQWKVLMVRTEGKKHCRQTYRHKEWMTDSLRYFLNSLFKTGFLTSMQLIHKEAVPISIIIKTPDH